jgi:membrane associated rhomboid family serine protease
METVEGYTGESADEWLAVTPEGEAGVHTESQVQLWSLVMSAREIPCRIVPHAGGWQLLVPAACQAVARRELTLFAEENRHWPPPEPPARPMVENTLATLSVLILLATFHNITRLHIPVFGHPAPDWVYLGSAKAHLVKYGEWWRLVTSLTLHADLLHLVSNLAIGGVFVVALCRELGSGLAWSLLLTAGTLGNLANAYTQLPTHSSVGASTTVFGAVGILAALNLVRRRFHRQRRWALPVAAALALLALLGTEGKNTDLGAHLFGFIFGAGLGLITEWLVSHYGRPRRRLNALLTLASAVVVVAAWWVALVYGVY